MTVREQLTSSALLRELPWYSSIILDKASLIETCADVPWVERFCPAVSHFEDLLPHSTNIPLKEFRLNLPLSFNIALDEEEATIGQNSKQTYALATALFNYRILDIATSLARGGPLEDMNTGSRRGTLPSKLLSTLDRNSDLKDWTRVVNRGLNSLRCRTNEDIIPSTTPMPNIQANVVTTLYASAVRRSHFIDSSNILRNIEVAAFNLAYLLQGNLDLPQSFEALASNVPPSAHLDALKSASEEMKNLRWLRFPLQVALAVSPIILFLDASLFRREVNRASLLKAWACLGGSKPSTLQEVERVLWRCLFDISSGKVDFNSSVTKAIEGIELLGGLNDVSKEDALWLSDDYQCAKGEGEMSDTSHVQMTAQPPKLQPQTSDKEPSEALDEEVVSKSVPQVASLLISVRGGLQSGASAQAAEDGGSQVGSVVAFEAELRRSTRQLNIPVPQVELSLPPSKASSSTSESGSKKRKRKSKDAGAKNAAVKKEPQAWNMRLTETVDLTNDLDSEGEAEQMPLRKKFKKKIKGLETALHGPHEAKAVIPEFHFEEDHLFFNKMVEACEALHVDGRPLFLSDPVKSVIRIMSQSEFDQKSHCEVQDLFSKQHIMVFRGTTEGCGFTADSLANVMNEDQKLSISDMSLAVKNGDYATRLRSGTMKDLLDHAESGNALNALDLPMERGIIPPRTITSDLWAWQQTIDLRLCKRTDRFPNSAMQWALVSTRGTFSPWHIDCDGLATVIEVKEGYKWWILARPKPGESPQDFNARIDAFIANFNPYAPNEDKWDCEAVLLTPGTKLYMRPNTPHCVFTLEPTIAHGAHFYATSTIRQTCIGLYHSFMAARISTNTDHEPETREILRRMVTFYHRKHKHPTYFNTDGNQAHSISFGTFNEVVDFLTVFNLMELANVVYSKTYGPVEIDLRAYYSFIESRRLCYEIIDDLDSSYRLESNDQRLRTVRDVQRLYFQRQVYALVEYKKLAFAAGYHSYVDGCTLEAFLREVKLVSNDPILDPFADAVDAPPSLCWPRNTTFSVHPKRSKPDARPHVDGNDNISNAEDGFTLADRLRKAKFSGDKEMLKRVEDLISHRLQG